MLLYLVCTKLERNMHIFCMFLRILTTHYVGQSSMKIYKANHDSDAKQRVAQHHLVADVGRESLFCIAFPAVTCFAGMECAIVQIQVTLPPQAQNMINHK